MTMEAKIRPWLLWTLIGAILIGGGFTYWYFSKNKTGTTATTSPTPTLSTAKKSPAVSPSATADTSDWQTFSEKDYGLSFKYPSNWTIQSKKITTTEHGQYTQGIIQIKEIILKSDKGDEFELRSPVKETGYEAWDWGKNKKDITSATGIKFARDYATPLPDSGFDTNRPLYLAISGTTGENYLKSVNLIGEFNSTDVHTVSNLDQILSTFQFTQ